MSQASMPFSAVILAGDRGPEEPLALAGGVSCKALISVGGRPMVLRVLEALGESAEVGARILCGPQKTALQQEPELCKLIDSDQVKWVEPLATPSSSTFKVLQSLPEETPVLVTTADHALLSTAMVDHFCREARSSGTDVLIGLARHELVAAAYPETRRTVTKLKDGGYCGCNLFAFLTPRARLAAEFWKRVEDQRKKPQRVIAAIGWLAVLRYLTGRLSLTEALRRLSVRINLKAGAILMPFPEAAIDVDKVADWKLVESILANKKG